MYIVAHCPYATALMLKKSAVVVAVVAAIIKKATAKIIAAAVTVQDPADVFAILLPLKTPPVADVPAR